VPVFHANVTAEEVRVDPGAGLAIAALVELEPAAEYA
jgi:hypothetical protein